MLAVSAFTTYFTIRTNALAEPEPVHEPECRTHCAVQAPPLEPDSQAD
jgi:hypothetical protein